MLLQNYCASEACCVYKADKGHVWVIQGHYVYGGTKPCLRVLEGQSWPGKLYLGVKMEFEACYCTITVPLRHVVPIGLIRAMCGIFGATKSRVAQSLACEYQRVTVCQVGSM